MSMRDARVVEMDDNAYDLEKWKMTPLQVLLRARERVASGTHPTAQEAIGRDTARECRDGSPVTKAWAILIKVFDSHYLSKWTKESHEAAYIGYQSISFFGEEPNREGELKALHRAIELAKALEVNETPKADLYWDRSAKEPWEAWAIRSRAREASRGTP